MKVGDIVRRVLHSGNIVGSYIIVMEKRKGILYGRYLLSDKQFRLGRADNTDFKVLKVIALQVPVDDWKRIANGWIFTYCHKLNGQWDNPDIGNYDIVKIFDNKGRKVYFTGCEFARIAKHEKGKLIPYVKIYLNARLFIEE